MLNLTESITDMVKRQFKILLESHTGRVMAIAITSDRKYVYLGSFDGTLRVWNIVKKNKKII